MSTGAPGRQSQEKPAAQMKYLARCSERALTRILNLLLAQADIPLATAQKTQQRLHLQRVLKKYTLDSKLLLTFKHASIEPEPADTLSHSQVRWQAAALLQTEKGSAEQLRQRRRSLAAPPLPDGHLNLPLPQQSEEH